VHHLGPLHALGMAGRGSVIAEPIAVDEYQRHRLGIKGWGLGSRSGGLHMCE
jgi:hypothetical protein